MPNVNEGSTVNLFIATRAIRCIADLIGCTIAEVTPDKHLVNNLGFDSLDQIQLVVALENEFGIEIDDSEVDGMQTVGDVIAKLEQKLMVNAGNDLS